MFWYYVISEGKKRPTKGTTMTSQDQEMMMTQKLAKIVLVTLVGLAAMFIVSGAALTMILH
jgi:hypothetical protein